MPPPLLSSLLLLSFLTPLSSTVASFSSRCLFATGLPVDRSGYLPNIVVFAHEAIPPQALSDFFRDFFCLAERRIRPETPLMVMGEEMATPSFLSGLSRNGSNVCTEYLHFEDTTGSTSPVLAFVFTPAGKACSPPVNDTSRYGRLRVFVEVSPNRSHLSTASEYTNKSRKFLHAVLGPEKAGRYGVIARIVSFLLQETPSEGFLVFRSVSLERVGSPKQVSPAVAVLAVITIVMFSTFFSLITCCLAVIESILAGDRQRRMYGSHVDDSSEGEQKESAEMSTTFDFSGKKIVVTGASQGIGRALCVSLSKAGADVYALARNKKALEELVAEVGPRIHALEGDVTAGAEELAALLEPHGPFHGLVNNAGVASLESAETATVESIDRTMAVNFRGPVVVSQIVVKGMKKIGGGSIVNVSSQASLVPIKDHLAYCSSKAALDMATRCMAAEFGGYNIRVNAVNPTVVLTEMGKKAWSDPVKAGELLHRMPIRRFAEEEDVVNGVMFLLSDASAMTTGHSLPIEGGFTTC